MEQTPSQTSNQPAPEATAQQTSQATPAPIQPQPSTPAPQAATTPPAPACKCPMVSEADWDKKKMQFDKTFYKTFSPRIFYIPFSFAIDIARARTAAISMGYKPVDKGMILDTGGMFWASVMVEVTDANAADTNVVSLQGKEVYTKVSKRPWKEIKMDIMEMEKEMGKKPSQVYINWTSCPKCVGEKVVKAVLIGLA